MRFWISVLIALTGAMLLGSGCANQTQWNRWDAHPTHFASGEHLWFSVLNQGKKDPPRVTRGDLQRARAQSWWGDPVVVRPRQVSAPDR
jgi:hypothetical protein